jgi:hypothetical protein
MSYVIPGGLPTLAHPLIGYPALGSRNSKKSGICRPPFPGIDLGWDGFTLSHLPWVGVKDSNYEADWQYGLFIRHELIHNHLAFTPFARLRWHDIYAFDGVIRKTFENGNKRRKRIPVPLRSNRTRNALEKRWQIAVDLHTRAELVEELFAIRSSLLETKAVWDINPDTLQPLIRRYQRVYGKYIEGFRKAYEAFDFLAGEIGEDAAEGLIYCAFETLQPTATFLTTDFSVLCVRPVFMQLSRSPLVKVL